MRRQHVELVKRLKKNPKDILEQLTEQKVDLLHMAVGLVGELIELELARYKGDMENVREEIGDCLFYTEGIFLVLGVESPEVSDCQTRHTYGGDVLDLTKKAFAYGQDIQVEKIAEETAKTVLYLKELSEAMRHNFDELRQENIDKLNKRYKDGYSDAKAKARADKNPGE